MRILGNNQLLSQISEIFKAGHFFHAGIISGPEGTGKKTMAKYIATGAVCIDKIPPCGRCLPCVKVEKGIHPDIDIIRPDGQQIKIDQIRDMRSLLHVLPNEAPRRVVIIEEAGRMNDNAQNAILKILEEPPTSVVILLVTDNEADLLPTIQSRCIHFRMQPLSIMETKQELLRRNSRLSETQAETYATMSNGRLGSALKLIENEKTDGYSVQIIKALAGKSVKDVIYIAASLEKSVKREAFADIIKDIRSQLSRAASIQSGSTEYSHEEDLGRIARLYSKSKLIKMVNNCSQLLEYCDANVGVGHIIGTFVSLISEEVIK